VPTVPPGRELVVTESGVTIAIERLAVAVRVGLLESVAFTVKLEVPAVVGVPEMTPVPAARLKPAGNVPVVTDQL
jgi:hypothetical protein